VSAQLFSLPDYWRWRFASEQMAVLWAEPGVGDEGRDDVANEAVRRADALIEALQAIPSPAAPSGEAPHGAGGGR
jgi:hypothetical protein